MKRQPRISIDLLIDYDKIAAAFFQMPSIARLKVLRSYFAILSFWGVFLVPVTYIQNLADFLLMICFFAFILCSYCQYRGWTLILRRRVILYKATSGAVLVGALFYITSAIVPYFDQCRHSPANDGF